MSSMKDLAVEIDEAGIDYNQVDLERVMAYRQDYWTRRGNIPIIQAIKEIYGGDNE